MTGRVMWPTALAALVVALLVFLSFRAGLFGSNDSSSSDSSDSSTRSERSDLPGASSTPGAGGTGTGGAARFPPSDAQKLALLIGIQDYPAELAGRFDDLRGTANDLVLMRDLLRDRFGFDDAGIRVVRDAQATVEGVVRAFDEHLLRRAQPGAEVLIYYSGHGSRVPDASSFEPDGHDSTFVCHDSRVDGIDGAYDLSDDAMYSLLRALTVGRGAWATVVTDSCHSGGAVRGGRPGARRFAEAGAAPARAASAWPFWPEGVPFLDDDERAEVELERCVHLAACADYETAYEYDFAGDGEAPRFHGILTFSLVQALRGAAPGETFLTIARRTSGLMQSIPDAPPQTMWLEGATGRELFGTSFRPPLEGFGVTREGRAHLRVAAGLLHGLVDGSILEVTDENQRLLGSIRTDRVDYDVSRARWVGEPGELGPATFMLGRPRSLPRDLPRLLVATPSTELARALDGNEWADVRAGEAARGRCEYVLELGGKGGEGGEGLLFSTAEGIELWRAERPVRDPVRDLPVEDLTRAFREEVQFRALWSLCNPAARGELWRIALRFVPALEAQLRQVPGEPGSPVRFERAGVEPCAGERGAPAVQSYRVRAPTFAQQASASQKDQLAILRIENATLEQVFVHVLSLPEDRDLRVLWPPRDVHDRPLQPDGSTVKDLRVWVGSSERWTLRRPMRDRYLVIASKRPIDGLRAFENERTRSDRGLPRGLADFPAVLRMACGGNLTRGGGELENRPDGWGIAWIDLSVEPR